MLRILVRLSAVNLVTTWYSDTSCEQHTAHRVHLPSGSPGTGASSLPPFFPGVGRAACDLPHRIFSLWPERETWHTWWEHLATTLLVMERAVQSITLRTSDNEFVEGTVHCFLCLLSRAEADKRTLLFGDHVKVPDLTKLVEVVPANQGTSDDNP